MAKSIAIMIVVLNRTFSAPRLVWNAELKLSLPPKAPPTWAPVFWIRIITVSNTDKIIWIYGRSDLIGC